MCPQPARLQFDVRRATRSDARGGTLALAAHPHVALPSLNYNQDVFGETGHAVA
jgi:hypothetical protein